MDRQTYFQKWSASSENIENHPSRHQFYNGFNIFDFYTNLVSRKSDLNVDRLQMLKSEKPNFYWHIMS